MCSMHEPMIDEWGLFFDTANGYDNRFDVVKAFTDFWGRTSTKRLTVPGKCQLGGRLGGTGTEKVFDSEIESIERLDSCNGRARRDLMCATTVSGKKYYFYSDEVSGYMSLMLSDILNLGVLNPRRYYYLGHRYYGTHYI